MIPPRIKRTNISVTSFFHPIIEDSGRCLRLNSVSDVRTEQTLLQRLAELQVKIQYLDTMFRTRQEDIQQLSQHIDQTIIDNLTFSLPTHELKTEIKQLIKNMSGLHAAAGINPPVTLRLPSSYNFMPHLLDDPNSLRLAYQLTKNRNGVSMVIGVPTVKREKQIYLMDTLQNLVDGMSVAEANDTLIVVFVAEVSNFLLFLTISNKLQTEWNI